MAKHKCRECEKVMTFTTLPPHPTICIDCYRAWVAKDDNNATQED